MRRARYVFLLGIAVAGSSPLAAGCYRAEPGYELPDGGTDADSDADTDADTDADSDADTDADSDTDSDIDADTDSDSGDDSDTETETDSDDAFACLLACVEDIDCPFGMACAEVESLSFLICLPGDNDVPCLEPCEVNSGYPCAADGTQALCDDGSVVLTADGGETFFCASPCWLGGENPECDVEGCDADGYCYQYSG